MSLCDLNLTTDLAIVTFTFKFLFRLYLENCKRQEVATLNENWLGV